MVSSRAQRGIPLKAVVRLSKGSLVAALLGMTGVRAGRRSVTPGIQTLRAIRREEVQAALPLEHPAAERLEPAGERIGLEQALQLGRRVAEPERDLRGEAFGG